MSLCANVIISNWKLIQKSTLKAAFSVELPVIGITIHGMTLHAKSGNRWVSFPAKPFTDENGVQGWARLVSFNSRERLDAFTKDCLAAIDEGSFMVPLDGVR